LINKTVLTLNVLCRRLLFLFIKRFNSKYIILVEDIMIYCRRYHDFFGNLKNDTSRWTM